MVEINLEGENGPPFRCKTLEQIVLVIFFLAGCGECFGHWEELFHALSLPHSGSGVMLIDVQRLGHLSAAGAGNCLHAKEHSERKRTCSLTQPFQQDSTLL